MAPRDQTKTPTKVLRSIIKTNTTKKGSQVATATATPAIKKTMSTLKNTDKTPIKVNSTAATERQRTNTVPYTPRPKDSKPAEVPGSVTRSGKKLWKRRPKPAHSGVPVPEKMRKLLEKQLANNDLKLLGKLN